MLGFNNPVHASFSTNGDKSDESRILLDEVNCTGQETDISECTHNGWGITDCTHSEDIGIDCRTPIKLSATLHSGLVEIQKNGTWQHLCGDSFNVSTAQVICKSLGFSANGAELNHKGLNATNISDITYECNGDEMDLSLCTSKTKDCSSNVAAAINCRTPIRLVNGTSAQSGRVEVEYGGGWGTICDDHFDDQDAKVVCRMLGFSDKRSRSLSGAYYGEGQGNIFIDELRCQGTEQDILECKSNEWLSPTNCQHNEDAAVECLTEVRLQGSPQKFVGRLEILKGAEWKGVCSNGFNNNTATVVCKSLGFERGNITIYMDGRYGSSLNGQTSNEYQCQGNETDLSNCQQKSVSTPCSPEVGMNCFAKSPMRLHGGPTVMSGFVEVYINGKWTGISLHGFTLNDTKVLCRSLGYPANYPSFRQADLYYSFTSYDRCLGGLGCTGFEQDITECIPQNGQWFNGSCVKREFVGINCGTDMQFRLTNGPSVKAGQVEVMYKGSWIGFCTNQQIGVFEANMICEKLGYNQSGYLITSKYKSGAAITGLHCTGNEQHISDCTANTWGTLSHCDRLTIACNSTVRLVNGTSERSGRVEILHQGRWGTICADHFDIHVADVVCRKAGIRLWNASVLTGSPFGRGNLPTVLNSTSCNGDEWDLSTCISSPWQDTMCNGTDVATVHCKVLNSPIRLVGGITEYDGEVEIKYKNIWSRIGSISGQQNVDLICALLGYNFSSNAKVISLNSSGDFLLGNWNCTGNELDVSLCSGYSEVLSTCRSTQAVVIDCSIRVRLVDGPYPTKGRVEVFNQGKWGPVCRSGINSYEGDVICRSAGFIYSNGEVNVHGRYSNETFQNFTVTNLDCTGQEEGITECKSDEWMTGHCPPNGALEVNCRPHTPLRLRNSSNNASSGIVEAFFDGSWLTICNNGFDDKAAAVVCRGLGYKAGESEASQTYDGSINIYHITCKGTENDISECQYSGYQWTRYRCGYYSAAVKCSNTRVQLRNGINRYKGRVEFQYNGIKGTICSEHFDDKDALVVCRAANIPGNQNATIYKSSKYGSGSSLLSIAGELNCTGTEYELDECAAFSLNANYPCSTHRYDVGVNCRPHTPIRLTNGTKYSGRVEIEYEGKWGTICDRDFDENDAKVICRMLGYNTRSVEVKQNAYYGIGDGHIIISNLACDGNEPDISECLTAGYKWSAVHGYCTAKNDAAVQCNTPTRVRDGNTAYSGIAEVYIDGSWRHICKDNFTVDDAITVCNLAGLRHNYTENVLILDASVYGVHQRSNQSVGSFQCKGDEGDLFECGSGQWTNSGMHCTSRQNVAINCRATSLVRLVSEDGQTTYKADIQGKASSTGRVEVFYMGKWGTICDDLFDNQDSQVLCAMMGYSIGRVNKSSYNNFYGDGNTVIDDLECAGVETDISQCKSREWGTHNCIRQENVFIDCDFQENVDPCEKRYHVRLPNLEQRTVYYKTNSDPINDIKLPAGWYYVGNVTMPSKPRLNSCGTHIPIYTSENISSMNNGIQSIKAVELGHETVTYDIQVKNCNNNFFVYHLPPTSTPNSGYCFGIGSINPPPSFVATSVQTILVHNNTSLWFKCKFETDKPDKLFYRVFWIVGEDTTLVKGFCSAADNMAACLLTDGDLQNNSIGMGDTIRCSVRAYYESDGQPGQMSEQSEPFFIGIKVLTPSITLRHGETKPIEMQLTVPIICEALYSQVGPCRVSLQYFVPEHDSCGAQVVTDGCTTILNKDNFPHAFAVNISTAANGQYGVAGQYSVLLRIPPRTHGYWLFWKTYKLAPIQVKVLPESDTKWRGKVCTARNDPHMYTFDQSSFEHHADPGDYVLYKHKLYDNVEIQHRIGHCTNEANKAKCNCGVGVRAGRDVYIINVCNNYIDIGYKMCFDKALSVKKDNDFTYTIYLPYGTAVRARIDNAPFMGDEGGRVLDLTVMPSLHNRDGNSTGLCGTLNGCQDDDMENKTESAFIERWKLNDTLSLFSSDVHERTFNSWVTPSCVCKTNGETELSCEKSLSTCTKGSIAGFHSCDDVLNRRSVRSLTNRPRLPIVRIPTSNPSLVRKKREAQQWTPSDAQRHCQANIQNSKAFELCEKVPATHTNISVENCILDIMLMNSTSWTSISRQSMQDTCQTQIHRNKTVIEVLIKETVIAQNTSVSTATPGQNISTPHTPVFSLAELQALKDMEKTIKEIQVLCANNCSGKGICKNGVLDEGHCDENKTDCTHAFVFGGVFAGSNLTCKLQYFNIDINGTRHEDTYSHEVRGDTETLSEAICPLVNARRRRDVNSDHFVQGYTISLSNDGLHFSNDTADVYIYNSHCQVYTYDNTNSTKSEISFTFTLKDGYCYIKGQCMFNGSMHMSDSLKCDPSMSKTGWTPVTTTTRTSTASSTIHTSTLTTIPKESPCKNSSDMCKNHPNTFCQEDRDTYQCVCQRYYEQLDNGTCKETGEPRVNDRFAEIVKNSNDAKEEVDIFRVEIILNYNVPEHDYLEIAGTYETYKTELKDKLTDYYRGALGRGLKDVYILDITEPSCGPCD
ncbi:deleted in malignant brain tumors 1 protein-like [Mya arenaria]|uniref:deleted in malignant brain tumors 1 protein-like n=1 Tax=Mya arenaria TaxID=6604 RepID=UPI0022E85880|nr:deleted in malignant brain tumors 1 protein-like [Mya arenaria]